MKKNLQIVGRIILGLIYMTFGAMGLAMALDIMSMPEQPPMPEAAMKFMEGIMATGYFFPFLKITEVTCGILLLLGIAPPVTLIVIAPVTLHIILFHLFLTPTPTEMILPTLMGLAQILAMSTYWKVYQPLFEKNVP
ncbi:MAG: DoxX family membrane protein [Candidatus Omnitrophica bacterium]|nr:DoxX family membrane protein [Saprospiraceae bacterium]MCB9748340.1 DoxX family membrane protein [Candidatus Omnitrophota bacterium]